MVPVPGIIRGTRRLRIIRKKRNACFYMEPRIRFYTRTRKLKNQVTNGWGKKGQVLNLRTFCIINGLVVVFCLTASQLAAHSRANSQTFNLPPILTRHRSTAELRVVGIETSRTTSLVEEPTPESNNIAMSRQRIRERHISSCVGLAVSLDVCTRNSQTYTYSLYMHACGSTEVVYDRKTGKTTAVNTAAILVA